MRFTNPLLALRSQLKKSPPTKQSKFSLSKPKLAVSKKEILPVRTPIKPKATGWGVRSTKPMDVNKPTTNETQHIIFKAPSYEAYKDCNLKEIPEIPIGHTLFYRANSTSSRLVEVILRHNGFIYSEATLNYTLRCLGPNLVPAAYTGMTSFQKLNHFPGTSERISHVFLSHISIVTRKDKLAANIEAMRQISKKEFDFIPRTFVLPDQFELAKKVIEKYDYSWIRKPWGKSSGRGIEVLDKSKILKKEKGYIISRYIDNPLLVNGYKFDLRLYVCVTSFDPLAIYMYKEGFARFATEPYRSPKDTVNRYVHLTNTAVNKLSDKYKVAEDIHSESGSKWSVTSLLKHLESKGVNSEKLMKDVQDVITKTFLTVQRRIVEKIENNVTYKKDNCFELFGFDILIDDKLKPWLIEVNLSPSLGCSSPMDYEVKSNMICDLLNLVHIKVPTESQLNGQVILPPPRDFQKEYERRGGWSRIYFDNNKKN